MLAKKPIYNYDLEQCNQSPFLSSSQTGKYCFFAFAQKTIFIESNLENKKLSLYKI